MSPSSPRIRLPLLLAVLAAGAWFGPAPRVGAQTEDLIEPPETRLDQPDMLVEPDELGESRTDDTGGLRPPPMLIFQRVQPLGGAAAERAATPLAGVLDQLPLPDYLAADDGAEGAEATESAAAVKAYVAARDAYQRHDLADAMQMAQRAIDVDPRMAAAHLLLGRIHTRLGDKDKARDAYRQAARFDPANPDVLFRLGQSAFENKQLAEAVVLFARTRDTQREVDPGITYMADYFLGQSLLRTGFDAAAAEPLVEYLREPEQFTRSTNYLRQVRLLGRQRDTVCVQLGDAAMRRGRFDEAADRYREVGGSSVVKPATIVPRLVYALAASERFDEAEKQVVALFQDRENVATAAALADYLAAVNPTRRGIEDAVAQAYQQADRPEAVAIALARLKDGEARTTFLVEHLKHKPDHVTAFRALVADLAGRDLGRLLDLTIDLMARAPSRADQMAAAVIASGPTPAQLQAAFDALPVDRRVSASGWYTRGMIDLEALDDEAAEAAFSKALDRDPDFVPAQAASIELKIAQGQSAEALRLAAAFGEDAAPRLRYLRTVAQQQIGRHDEAIEGLKRLIAEQPSNTDYLITYAASLRATREFDAAEDVLLRAIKIDRQQERAYEALFEIYERERPDVTKYRQLLAMARQAIPNGRITRLKTARLYAAVGETSQAEALLRDLISDRPDDIDALGELAAVLGRAERWPEMVALLERLLDADPGNLAALETLRSVSRATEDYGRFYPRYEAYLKSRPDLARWQIRLAELYSEWGRIDDAVGAYDKVIAGETNGALRAAYQARVASMLHDHGRADEAIARMDRAIADADAANALAFSVVKAMMLADADRGDEAVKLMDEAIAAHPDEADELRLDKARVLASANRFDEALAEVDRVIATMPGRAADLYYMQSTLLHGRPESAALYEKVLLKALEADANHAPANNDLAYTWVEQGRNLAKAEQMIRKAVAVEADSAAYLDSLGWVLYKRGKFAESAAWLNKARQAPGGDDPVIVDHLGDALWQAGQTDEAVRLWRATLDRLEARGDRLDASARALLPVLRRKLDAAGKGDVVPVAAVPEEPAEDKPPDLPMPQMQ